MKLSLRQQRALQSICATCAPAENGWPPASELGIPAAIASGLDFNPRAADRAQFLRKAIGFLYVMLPGANGARSRVWDKLQYPGPHGAQKAGAPRALTVTVPDAEMKLSCDVCIVGSGAGGATAAAVLPASGADVIVLEAGGYFDDADFDGAELRAFQRFYAEAGNAATADQSVSLLAGECLGGTTVINFCTSFLTPDDVRKAWAAVSVPWFA